jgi:hypothetical protein
MTAAREESIVFFPLQWTEHWRWLRGGGGGVGLGQLLILQLSGSADQQSASSGIKSVPSWFLGHWRTALSKEKQRICCWKEDVEVYYSFNILHSSIGTWEGIKWQDCRRILRFSRNCQILWGLY